MPKLVILVASLALGAHGLGAQERANPYSTLEGARIRVETTDFIYDEVQGRVLATSAEALQVQDPRVRQVVTLPVASVDRLWVSQGRGNYGWHGFIAAFALSAGVVLADDWSDTTAKLLYAPLIGVTFGFVTGLLTSEIEREKWRELR